jgi:hypothetical protein
VKRLPNLLRQGLFFSWFPSSHTFCHQQLAGDLALQFLQGAKLDLCKATIQNVHACISKSKDIKDNAVLALVPVNIALHIFI